MAVTISPPFRLVIKAPPEFFVTFASSINEGGLQLQARAPDRASIVPVGRHGNTAVRLQTVPGDNNLFGSGESERCDLTSDQQATDGFEGRQPWWAHSILFPDDYVDPPQSALVPPPWHFATVFDFHHTGSTGQANFQVNAMPVTATSPDRPTGLNFQISSGNPNSPAQVNVPIGPVVRNVWFDFVYNIRWASDGSGFIKGWVNGALKLNYTGPTLYPGQGVYLKLANYHSPFGSPSSVIHDRIIRGTTWQEVSLGPLQGVS